VKCPKCGETLLPEDWLAGMKRAFAASLRTMRELLRDECQWCEREDRPKCGLVLRRLEVRAVRTPQCWRGRAVLSAERAMLRAEGKAPKGANEGAKS
jgi:hypothetical protein